MELILSKILKKGWLVALLFIINFEVNAQTRTDISGKVTDSETGEPVAGATVKISGTTAGVITAADGTFKLSSVAPNFTITVTFIGYKDYSMKLENASLLDIRLVPSLDELEEVVVVAYGTQKKVNVTGAVDQIDSKTFESRAVTNVGLALQGQTPGLLVTRNSPRPGNEGIAFQIRGATSVNGGSPLIVIDGVPGMNWSALQQMNPDDIESVSVLKDGSAAIYGSRAANGVILVTTKKGKDKLQVEYTNNLRFTTNGITGYAPGMREYASVWLEANKEESIPNWWGWISKENMEKMQQGIEGVYPTQFWGDVFIGDANRIDELFARRYSHQHNLSIGQRGEKSGYRLSFGYADNKANLATAYDGQRQYNLRLNHDYTLSKRVKLESGVTLQNSNTSSPSAGLDGSLFAYDMPFFPAKNPMGQWNANFGRVGGRNAAAATADGGRDDQFRTLGRLDLKATFDILSGLALETYASVQGEEFRRERYVTPVALYDWYGNQAENGLSSTLQSSGNPGYATWSNRSFYEYYSAILRYTTTLAEHHNFTVLGGVNAEKYQNKNLWASRVNFEDNGVYDLNIANADIAFNSGGKNQRGFYSYIARVNYNFKEKYLVEALGRKDGASMFDDGLKFKNFGNISLGWVFTNEDFMSDFRVLNFGKLRASSGVSGNNVGIGNYDYVSTVNNGTTALGYPAILHPSSGLAGNGLISRNRTWERVYQKNIALDLGFFNNKLTTTFDYFWKDNKGMLVNVNYPSVLGGSAPRTNSGHLSVKGWEFIATWKDKVKDFNYNISFNISDNRTLLRSMEGADIYGPGRTSTVNGYPLNSWFLYQTDGYFKNQEEIDAYYIKYGNNAGELSRVQGVNVLRPGDIKRVDVNGDGLISNAFNANDDQKADYVYMGDSAPHFVFGTNLSANWKGFDFNAFFQGVGKQNIMRGGWMAYPFATQYTNQPYSYIGKTWTEENPNAEYPRLTSYPSRANWNYANNDFMLQNNRYVRLKTLILGYTIPKSITQKAGLEKLRIYFSGNDLWEVTSIKDGYDPEQGETTQNSGYPFARTWSFGVNIGL